MSKINRWFNAIENRRSIRGYNRQPVEEEKIYLLDRACAELSMPGARAVLLTEGMEMVFKGAVGSFGKAKGAPAYIAFIGDLDDEHVQEKIGYVGEGVVLEAVSQGLATCWIGGLFRPEAAAKHTSLKSNERVLAVTPVGYPKAVLSIDERIQKSFAKSHTRKELTEIVSGLPQEQRAEWIRTALEAARIAPSAVNRQPWRFLVDEQSIVVSVDSMQDTFNISKRLDCGIAMRHIEVGAKHAGVDGQWEYLEAPGVARFNIGECC